MSKRPSLKRDLPILSFKTAASFATWLAGHHDTSKGIWLKIAKKDAGASSLSYAQAVEIMLCHGWIDGQKARLDDAFWLQRLTPRGPRSPWSRINRDKAQALIAAGHMAPAGLAAVEGARRDGRWERAYEPQSTAVVPPDLEAALAGNPAAAAFFASVDRVNRYAILHRLHGAKKPETRLRRLAKFVDMLERGETIYPSKRAAP